MCIILTVVCYQGVSCNQDLASKKQAIWKVLFRCVFRALLVRMRIDRYGARLREKRRKLDHEKLTIFLWLRVVVVVVGSGVPEALEKINNIQHATVSLPGEDTFLIFGGRVRNGTETSARVVKFDPAGSRWQILAVELENARYSHAGTRIPGSFNCK